MSGQSAGFYLAIHRITDGFGLQGTLRSISWVFLRWFARNTDFLFHRQNSVSKKCFLLQGCVPHFLFSVFSGFSLPFQSPLHAHISECSEGSQQSSRGSDWARLDLQAFPSGARRHFPAVPSPCFMGKVSVIPTQGTAEFSSAPLLHRRMAVCPTIQLFHWKNNKAAEE